jgi:uncharacterized protein (TIGR02118 family)
MTKIMLLLHRRADSSVEEFRRNWRTEHRALLVRLPGLRRQVLTEVLPRLDGAPGPCDGIAEDWFDSPEAMQRRSRRPRSSRRRGHPEVPRSDTAPRSWW